MKWNYAHYSALFAVLRVTVASFENHRVKLLDITIEILCCLETLSNYANVDANGICPCLSGAKIYESSLH